MAREWTVREHVAKEAFRKEKRQIPRLKVELDGSLIQMDTQSRVFTRNVSAHGVYLLTDAALRLNERVKTELRLPSSTNRRKTPNSVAFAGTVLRIQRLPDGKFGLGIRFDNWLLDKVLESELRSVQ